MPSHYQPFKPILYPAGKLLNTYQQKINLQQQALGILKSVLPDNIAIHALYCVITDHKLLVYTDSSNWSSQLRFYHPVMLNKIVESGWKQIQLLQIRIIPEQVKPSLPHSANIPSKKNIQFIRQQLQSQTDDKLNTALLKLCDTLDRLSDKKD